MFIINNPIHLKKRYFYCYQCNNVYPAASTIPRTSTCTISNMSETFFSPYSSYTIRFLKKKSIRGKKSSAIRIISKKIVIRKMYILSVQKYVYLIFIYTIWRNECTRAVQYKSKEVFCFCVTSITIYLSRLFSIYSCFYRIVVLVWREIICNISIWNARTYRHLYYFIIFLSFV